MQLSSGKVTSDPPSGDKVDSICKTGNVTCIGEPEISTYLRGEFKKKYDDIKTNLDIKKREELIPDVSLV